LKPGLCGLLRQVGRQDEYFVLGDFSSGSGSRYSYFGVAPREVLAFSDGDSGDPFDLLSDACGKYKLDYADELPMPFVGGWVGYLSYDLGRHVERLPDTTEHDIPLELLRFGFYDGLLAWDHGREVGYLLGLEYAGQKTSAAERLGRLREIYYKAVSEKESSPAVGQWADNAFGDLDSLVGRVQCNIERDDYLRKVEQAIEYIKAGDIFEVNLSQRFSRGFDAGGSKLYQYLTGSNPADYAALLNTADNSIVSVSPELFLSKRGEHIVTRPIKGTTSRGVDKEQDKLNRQKLLESQKDIAELNMIIDLERNDLGRICRYGSVEVVEERAIEAHPTVYHTVATVAGLLWDTVGIADILRATFPGGSITGAPKIRAMEIIDELEPTARSVYTGSIGWIGVNGDMDLNIAIRTIVLAKKKAYVQAGGAVVADSTAVGEYEETLAKAAALLRALDAVGG